MDLTPQRLGKMVLAASSKMEQARRSRVKMISQYVGRFYRGSKRTDDEASKAAPINLIHTAVTTLLPNLVFNSPRAKVETSVLEYREYSELLGNAVTMAAKRMNLKSELRFAVLDALFFAGFIKTGLAVGDKIIQIEGTDINIGEPFAERVDPDDMILDPQARAWDEQAFIGNKFRVDVQTLIDRGYGDPDMLLKLADSEDTNGVKDRASEISGSHSMNFDEPRKYVTLAEIYLPHEQRIVTIPIQRDTVPDMFIRDVGYDGPEHGPYHMLGFAPVPDNLLPVSPVSIWYDLHILGNRVARKLARQADRNKRVLAFEDDAEDDVNNIADASDGETVRVTDLNKIKEVEFGGASDQSYAYMEWVKRQFSEQAGSIDMLSGTGSSAGTATEAEMLQANSSVRLDDMKGQVYEFTASVMKDIAFFLHTDPLIELPLIRRVNGVEQQELYTPEMRKGEWLDYNLEVEPFSMARPDPNQQIRRRLEFATNIVPAAANAAMVLGPGFNVSAFLTRMAKEVGIDDADEWLNTAEMQQFIMMKAQQSMTTGDPGKAANDPFSVDSVMARQPNQPNPMAMGPNGGVSPSTEQNMMAQEATAPAQAGLKMGGGL